VSRRFGRQLDQCVESFTSSSFSFQTEIENTRTYGGIPLFFSRTYGGIPWSFPWFHQRKRKGIHGSWENVWEHFSSHQWKGGGIDGWVSPRTGASERIVLVHCTGTRRGCAWWGNALLLLVLKNLARFLKNLENPGFSENVSHILVWGRSTVAMNNGDVVRRRNH
jgi:hypothetical protein